MGSTPISLKMKKKVYSGSLLDDDSLPLGVLCSSSFIVVVLLYLIFHCMGVIVTPGSPVLDCSASSSTDRSLLDDDEVF